MKVVILAGGFGTRISEESATKPKPMVEVGGLPILWHIMKHYSHYGLNDFIICLGYKGHVIKEFFSNYLLATSDVRISLQERKVEFLNQRTEPWNVTLVETGTQAMTGGRMLRIREHVGDETFCLTYGDGVSDVDLHKLIAFHRTHGIKATVTAVQPPGRFGAFLLGEDQTHIAAFREKPTGDDAWINGGYFVLEPSVLDLIEGEGTTWEQEPMQALAQQGQLCAFKHAGFWQPMDTLRDHRVLEDHWASGRAPWKLWSD